MEPGKTKFTNDNSVYYCLWFCTVQFMVHNIDNFSAKMGNKSIAKNNKGVKAKGKMQRYKRENMRKARDARKNRGDEARGQVMEPAHASTEEPILEAFVEPIVQGNHTVEQEPSVPVQGPVVELILVSQ